VVATGADGSAWEDPGFNNFSFQRQHGNPSNIPYDGASHTMGTATWNSGVPAGYNTIVLHINDAAECDRLYGGNPGTCFVLPGERPQERAQPPTVAKTASPSFEDKFTWTISKSVDKTIVKQIGGSATFYYTIAVTYSDPIGFGWKVQGTITISNSNVDDITVDTVTDTVDNGGICTVTDGTNVTVPGRGLSSEPGTVTLTYSCTSSSAPNPSSGTNTATAAWSDQTLAGGAQLPAGTASGSATFTFGTPSDDLDECVTVTDSYAGSLGTACVGGANPTTFTYSRTITVPQFDCQSYDNTATFTTNDTGAQGTASQTVTVCRPARTGALTIGFWKTTNGQNLIKTYCQNPARANYLKGLGGGSGPFSNAPTTSCNDLASYVLTILNRATATDMNIMLKAQMLGTALDVWFSGPGWTSTSIGGVKPPSNFLSHNNLGTFKMDTTAVCPEVGTLNTGTATCQNNTPSTDAVAAGAVPSSPMSMQAILDFAATTPSPFNGSTSSSIWYGGDRTKEEILKNIFDQFNNQLAFGSF